MKQIKDKKALVSVPGLIDLPKVGEGVAAIVLETMQSMMLKLALYLCHADWETRRERQKQGIAVKKEADKSKPLAERTYRGRKPDQVANAKIVELRSIGYTIAKVASTLNVSEPQVKLILKKHATEQTNL